jgi:subtilase family serine protease
MKKRILVALGLAGLIAVAAVVAASGGKSTVAAAAYPAPRPTLDDYAQVSTSTTPPTEAQCFTANNDSGGRRCFTPASMRSAYNLGGLISRGEDGRGETIAIIDSFGSDTVANDLHVFDSAFGVTPMCGETGVTCAPGMPTFSELTLNGSPATTPQPGNGNHLQDKTGWAIEVSLDVEWAHAIAPGANILLVHTPVAETLGTQGFPNLIKSEDYVVQNGLAQVISQSFGSAEQTFGNGSLDNLRFAFADAANAGVTVLASSGDGGSTNGTKQSLVGKGGGGAGPNTLYPFPTVGWPASDPLVTGVGGTYLCTNPTAAQSDPRTIDNTDPPATCQAITGVTERGWIDAGGGFSSVFARPDYQGTLPAGSTAIPAGERGVPDVGYQASSRTGVLVYVSLPPVGSGGAPCGAATAPPCSTGWYIVGGTSSGSPQWAGLVAIADQLNGGPGLGLINPALYKIGSDPTRYAKDFFDVTTGNNGAGAPAIPGFPATTGWDPVTGLGTPNAANLLPDLVAAVHGH